MKIKTMLYSLAGLGLFALVAAAIVNQPPRASYTYMTGCQGYGCALPVGFKGWPQL